MARRSISDRLETIVPGEPVDVVGQRPRRSTRNRNWERRMRVEQGQVSYRGVPEEVNKQVKQIAQELGVTTGEVARRFLEYGLEAYESGRLELEVYRVPGRHTLFPPDS